MHRNIDSEGHILVGRNLVMQGMMIVRRQAVRTTKPVDLSAEQSIKFELVIKESYINNVYI